MKNTLFLSIAAAAALALTASGGVQAASWPDEEKVITIIVPYSAGGGTDMAFRPLVEAGMSAMDNATRNAGEMIDKLTTSYNRQRQAQITTELIEIIAGAEAL